MTEETKDIQLYAPESVQSTEIVNTGAFSGSIAAFENAQRIAGALSKSTLVPQDYRGNVANCMIALEMAQRVNANPLAVMQNLYIVHGKPSWSSQFTIAALNGCGRFSALRFEVTGQGDEYGCTAWAYDKDTGDKLEGPRVSIAMSKAEGWYGKNGSKWKTMPDLMLRYRAASFFGRLYAPDLLMGMSTEDEMSDIVGRSTRRTVQREVVVNPAQGFNPAKPAELQPENGDANQAAKEFFGDEDFAPDVGGF